MLINMNLQFDHDSEMVSFFERMGGRLVLVGDSTLVNVVEPQPETGQAPQQLIVPARGVGRPKGSKTKVAPEAAPAPEGEGIEAVIDAAAPVDARFIDEGGQKLPTDPPAEIKPAIVPFDALRLLVGEAAQTNGIGVGGAIEMMSGFKDKDGAVVKKINAIREEDSAEFAALVRARIVAALAKGA